MGGGGLALRGATRWEEETGPGLTGRRRQPAATQLWCPRVAARTGEAKASDAWAPA